MKVVFFLKETNEILKISNIKIKDYKDFKALMQIESIKGTFSNFKFDKETMTCSNTELLLDTDDKIKEVHNRISGKYPTIISDIFKSFILEAHEYIKIGIFNFKANATNNFAQKTLGDLSSKAVDEYLYEWVDIREFF